MKLDRPQIETWDKVSEFYSMDIPPHEENISNEILDVMKKYGITKSDTFIELGSGSGHISGIFNKHGHKVTLLDFSKVALEKSREFFNKHNFNGEFIEGDIFNLPDLKKTFDISWNYGVMEHFDDEALYKALLSIRKATNKYFVIVLPNPESFTYLLHRLKIMKSGYWIYGTEYLRTDYKEFLKQTGFELVAKEFICKDLTLGMIDVLGKNKELSDNYTELLNAGLMDNSKSLVCYVAKVTDIPADSKVPFGDTRKTTEIFDAIAGFSESIYIPKISFRTKVRKLLKRY